MPPEEHSRARRCAWVESVARPERIFAGVVSILVGLLAKKKGYGTVASEVLQGVWRETRQGMMKHRKSTSRGNADRSARKEMKAPTEGEKRRRL